MWPFSQSNKRGNEGTGPARPPQEGRRYYVATVRTKAGAQPDDLRALGEALQAFMERHKAITQIIGLNNLLAGQFPPMEEYIGYINEMSLAAPKWQTCPAILCSPDVYVDNESIMKKLKAELPHALYSHIGWPAMD